MSSVAAKTTGDVPARPVRVMAAIVPQKDRVWFFKMVGDDSDVGAKRGEFRRLVESVKFNEQGEPSWEVPDGWREEAGSGMRKATLKTGLAPQAANVTVIGLAAPQDVLSNVNRWRAQIQLPPIEPSDLADEGESLTIGDTKVQIFDLRGSLAQPPSAMDTMSGMPNPHRKADSPQAADFQFESPEGWTEIPASGMRKAAFQVQAGDQEAEFTVITLPPAAAAVLPNINRWRDQLGLATLEENEVGNAIRKIKVDSSEGSYVELLKSETTSDATVAAIVPRSDRIWFFKLTGAAEVVEREEENFERFLQSVKFGENN